MEDPQELECKHNLDKDSLLLLQNFADAKGVECTCPLCRQPIKKYKPNSALKQTIEAYKKEYLSEKIEEITNFSKDEVAVTISATHTEFTNRNTSARNVRNEPSSFQLFCVWACERFPTFSIDSTYHGAALIGIMTGSGTNAFVPALNAWGVPLIGKIAIQGVVVVCTTHLTNRFKSPATGFISTAVVEGLGYLFPWWEPLVV